MSSIPAAKERLTNLSAGNKSWAKHTATPQQAFDLREDAKAIDAILAELSRLEEVETLMTWLAQRPSLELDWGAEDEESDAFWRVHSVHGGVNDREWTLVGIGRTPIEAIRNARAASLITKGGADV